MLGELERVGVAESTLLSVLGNSVSESVNDSAGEFGINLASPLARDVQQEGFADVGPPTLVGVVTTAPSPSSSVLSPVVFGRSDVMEKCYREIWKP